MLLRLPCLPNCVCELPARLGVSASFVTFADTPCRTHAYAKMGVGRSFGDARPTRVMQASLLTARNVTCNQQAALGAGGGGKVLMPQALRVEWGRSWVEERGAREKGCGRQGAENARTKCWRKSCVESLHRALVCGSRVSSSLYSHLKICLPPGAEQARRA